MAYPRDMFIFMQNVRDAYHPENPYHIENARVVHIPSSVQDPSELADRLQEGLSAPAKKYPRQNRSWQLIREMLLDLSWISEENVIIIHDDIPLSEGDSQWHQHWYLDSLAGASLYTNKRNGNFKAVFPEDLDKNGLSSSRFFIRNSLSFAPQYKGPLFPKKPNNLDSF